MFAMNVVASSGMTEMECWSAVPAAVSSTMAARLSRRFRSARSPARALWYKKGELMVCLYGSVCP
jgi:hypothetical protein